MRPILILICLVFFLNNSPFGTHAFTIFSKEIQSNLESLTFDHLLPKVDADNHG